VDALANDQVADYLNENFICTYLKVGTFQIVNGQKIGGNVASYFCLHDGSVVHALPGKTKAAGLLNEARWAHEVRKSALTLSTNLVTGSVDMARYQGHVRHAHEERFLTEINPWLLNRLVASNGKRPTQGSAVLPPTMPRNTSLLAQAHWLLANSPLAKIDHVYPTVWTTILNEQLSALPIAKR
jgi:hypothetical protein